MTRNALPKEFYTRTDVTLVARQLLGKVLYTQFDNTLTGGVIVETEAYRGEGDRACHACRFGKTARTEVMFQEGGRLYVYLCYGIHNMVNVVTNTYDCADAVLIRALSPLQGIESMMERRRKTSWRRITSGPGTVGEALGFKVGHSGLSLLSPAVWIEDRAIAVDDASIISTRRIGVDYAGEDASKPWRYYIYDSPFVSKK